MPLHLPSLATRTVALLAGSALLCRVVWSLARGPLCAAAALGAGAGDPRPLETALLGVCAAALLTCVAWGVGVTLLYVAGLLAAELHPGSHRAARLLRRVERRCPPAVRRLAAAALGLTLGAGAALPATATIDAVPVPGPLSGLQLPDRPTGAGLATTGHVVIRGRPGPAAPQTRFVVVRPGDSLWRIARSALPVGATDLDITRAWHHIDRANATRLGDDPNLIHPGTRLLLPAGVGTHRKDPA